MRLIDTHAHLDDRQFEHDLAEVLARARAASVGVIAISTSLPSARRTLEIARAYGLPCTVGIHPHEAGACSDQSLEELERLARQPRVVAIGEIGLDFFKQYAPRERQLRALEAQLALAQRLEKPVVLHLREAASTLLAALRRSAVRGVLHSFTGDRALAERLLDLGLHLSVNGILTFARDRACQEAVAWAPLERLLVETDAPYLAPAPHRGRRNEPAYVRHVAERLAQLKNLEPEEVARATTRNAQKLFRLVSAP